MALESKRVTSLRGSRLELMIFLGQGVIDLFLLMILMYFKKYCILTDFTNENFLCRKTFTDFLTNRLMYPITMSTSFSENLFVQVPSKDVSIKHI